MKNHYNTAVFASVLLVILLLIMTMVGIQYHNQTVQNDLLRQKVDSLSVECKRLNVSLDEATSIALSLSDRMGKLYEMDPATHKKLFSETD